MVDVPALTPVAMPLVEPIVATPVLPLLHVPPGTLLLSVVVAPWHTEVVPPMAEGAAFTVNTVVAIQPVGSA